MKPTIEIFLGLTTLAALATFCAVWLWFMIRRPVQWASFLNREKAFWAWFIAPSFVEKCSHIEKSLKMETGLKLLVIAGLIVNAGGFLYVAFLIIRSSLFSN